MDYRESIVRPAWDMIERESILKRFNFVPSLISTLFLCIILVYQVAYTYIRIFDLNDEFFSLVLSLSDSFYFWELLAGIIAVIFLSIVLTPWAEGGLIALIDSESRHPEEEQHFSYGFGRGLKHFLVLFEFHNVMSLFRILSIITFTIFMVRIMGKEYSQWIITIAVIYFLLACVVNMLTSYAKCFIVLGKKKAFEAVTASVSMAIENLGITVRLYFSLLFVYARTIIVALVVIMFPFMASAVITYFSIAALQMIAFVLLWSIFIVFLIVISHLNNVLEIFIEGVWYNAYQLNKSHSGHDDHSHGHADHHDTHWNTHTHGRHDDHTGDHGHATHNSHDEHTVKPDESDHTHTPHSQDHGSRHEQDENHSDIHTHPTSDVHHSEMSPHHQKRSVVHAVHSIVDQH